MSRKAFSRHGINGLICSENVAAEHTATPDLFIVGIGAEILGAVLIHCNFFPDNAFFKLNILGGKLRVHYHVADNVKSLCAVLRKSVSIKTGHFFGGVCVEHSADFVHFNRNVKRRTLFGSFEKHMLNKM